MKISKKSIVFFAGLLMLTACTTQNYEINGSIDSQAGMQNGMAYITKRVVREWITVDSTQIENGKFTFAGTAALPYAAYIQVAADGKKQIITPLIVEPGKIEIQLTADNIICKGTQQNELLQQFFDGPYESENIDEIMDFVLQNINTEVGNYAFTQSYYIMSVEQKEQVIAAMNEQSLQYDRVPLIIKGMEKEKKVAPGKTYIDIQLPNVSDNIQTLSSVVGKYNYVLIDFWASWCGPCKASFPALTVLYNTYKGTEKFEIFGVSLDSNKENWQAAIEKYGLIWHQVSDLKGWESAGADIYGVNAIPATILIDKQGTIVGRNMNIEQIEQLLQRTE